MNAKNFWATFDLLMGRERAKSENETGNWLHAYAGVKKHNFG
jgi:hypothetical protein